MVFLKCVVAAFVLALPQIAQAQSNAEREPASPTETFEPAQRQPLRIGTKITPPFVIQPAEGELDGLSVELWREVASRLDLEYEFVVRELEPMLDGVANGELDAAIAAISVTPEREERLDFSRAYFTSGLGIAVPESDYTRGFLRGILALMTPGFWVAVGSLAFILLIVGVIAWLAERKQNPDEFGGNVAQGIGSGFWFSAVTMTTVGYGDIAPRSVQGRVVALVWMFASVIIISTFTGAIASSVTAASLTAAVAGPDDLAHAKIAAVRDTAGVESLRDRGVSPRLYDTVGAALEAVAAGDVDAVVHDAPILKHAVAEDFPSDLRVLSARFNLRPYAIALPEESDDAEPLNQVLLEVVDSAEWRAAVERWVGDD